MAAEIHGGSSKLGYSSPPFLRSDCTGDCEFSGLSHSHSHRHHHHNNGPQKDLTAPATTSKIQGSSGNNLREFNWAKSNGQPQSDIIARPRRTTRGRSSVLQNDKYSGGNLSVLTKSKTNLTVKEVERIRAALDVDSPERTDYTYSHSFLSEWKWSGGSKKKAKFPLENRNFFLLCSTYVKKKPSPGWQNPKLSRLGLRKSSRYSESNASEQSSENIGTGVCGYLLLFLLLCLLLGALSYAGWRADAPSHIRNAIVPLPLILWNRTKDSLFKNRELPSPRSVKKEAVIGSISDGDASVVPTPYVTKDELEKLALELAQLREKTPVDYVSKGEVDALAAALAQLRKNMPTDYVAKDELDKLALAVAVLRDKVPADHVTKDEVGQLTAALSQVREDLAVLKNKGEIDVSNFLTKADVELLADTVDQRIEPLISSLSSLVNDVATMKSRWQSAVSLPEAEINALIAAAVAKYDLDKTGLPDFALESSGGSIVSTRCSETYSPRTRQESVWGIPLWYSSYSPRIAIQRTGQSLVPGQCWSFKGTTGYLVIRLSGRVQVSHVSYEHIDRQVALDGHIESAPKRFEVLGLQHESSLDKVLLGTDYIYLNDTDQPLQFFKVQNKKAPPVNLVELRVVSNHGHPVYTCLYRFRVHGRRVAPAYGILP